MNPESDRWVRSDEARAKLRDLLDEVAQQGSHVYVLRYDKPAAVLVPVGWHDAVTALIEDMELLETRGDLIARKYNDRIAALRAGRRTVGLAPQDGRVVNHIDGNPYNDPSNLEIVDPKENR